ncbi:hypothetical protein [Deinococcus sp. SL84]|uniref:hypothetical protein n=1 Tax=Deinococcus sp. SL84 TaxID=2994663 RepID=UPI0002FE8025|nr:hypothetical protein [Deinococcus sp. SL84]MCY1701979.1 hypothetical protein [Deinococcus sp. SL84]
MLTEHHTGRTVEALSQPTPANWLDTLSHTADYVQALAAAQARMDWDTRGRVNHRLSAVLERFHFSALLACPQLTWEDVAPLDSALAELGFGLCVLTLSESALAERLATAAVQRHPAWQAHAQTLGHTAEAQAHALAGQQARLLELAERSRLPLRVIAADGLDLSAVAAQLG